MNPLKKIKGEFSELISNEAGIPSNAPSSAEVRKALRVWKKEAKRPRVDLNNREASYWEKMSACANL